MNSYFSFRGFNKSLLLDSEISTSIDLDSSSDESLEGAITADLEIKRFSGTTTEGKVSSN